jgi:micrococcal nuclease
MDRTATLADYSGGRTGRLNLCSFLLATLLLPIIPASTAADATNALFGEVMSVVAGDTITVRIGNRVETIRYLGIKVPESHNPPKGKNTKRHEASEANRELVEGQRVRLESDVQERDSSGRLLAYVYVGEIMVNEELIAQGQALANVVPPNVRYQELFLMRQRQARLLHIGIWRGAPSTAPQPAAPQSTPILNAQSRPGVQPEGVWTCPLAQPIKGNFTTYSGERCIYHQQGGEFYSKTKPERCYATEEEARLDGCRRSMR